MKNILLVLVIILVLCVPAKAVIFPIGPGVIQTEEIPYSSDAKFPKVYGINLEGQTVNFPEAFTGKNNIVIVSFDRAQQADVNSWTTALKELMEAKPSIAKYQIFVTEKSNFFARWANNNGLRYAISDKKARENSLCAYLDKASFKAKLGLMSEDQIVLLIVNEQGNIIAKVLGPAIPGMVNHVTALLQ